jgi:hypothetical protein
MRNALLAVLGLASVAMSQSIPLPAFGNSYIAPQTRGYWFQAPANGIVIGMAVPNEASQPFQVIEFIDLGASPPPAYPTTVVGTQLFYDNSSAGGSTIATSVPIVSGNYYGVLGACTASIGNTTSYNSYGTPAGAFASSILGIPTTLTRFGTQFGIAAGGNNPVWQEPAGQISRVELTIIPSGSGTIATNTTLGAGCISVADVSSYENFATSAAFDLSNTSITLIHTGAGYLAIPGTTAYVAPSGSAQVLTLTDDSEATVTLSQPMPVGASGSTTSLTVCSNGYISAATGNGTTFTPTVATFLNGPQAWWSLCWHDYNTTIAGSGQVKFEQIGTTAYITWDGVWDYGGTTAANANTMQAQFDLTTGTVHYVYGTMSTLGNGRLVGFSDAGTSADPGSMDISAALPSTYTAATFRVVPLALAASTRPVIGTSWNFNTTQVPSAGTIGIDILGLSDPNIPDLAFLGAPGCGVRASLDSLSAWIVAGNTHAWSLALPNDPALANVHIYSMSAVLQPGVNTFLGGIITSNGIDGLIGTL